MNILRSLVNRKRIGDQGRGHELFGGQRIRLDRPLAAVLKRRLADRSAARPLAFAPVVVLAAGVFTLFAVCYFTVWTARGVAGVARLERSDERAEMIGYIFGRSVDRPDLDVHRVVNVIGGVPGVSRHQFVPAAERVRAYHGPELPIGWGRTTPDAYIVALMAELAVPVRTHEVEIGAGREARVFTTPTLPVSGHKVLEVGTGAGYLAAVLSEMVDHVYTIEPVEALAEKAAATLGELGYGNVTVQVGDPFEGWPEFAPFDSIVVKSPVAPVPPPLIDQLALGGKLVAPVGPPEGPQALQVLEKQPDGTVAVRSVLEMSFPPLTGR